MGVTQEGQKCIFMLCMEVAEEDMEVQEETDEGWEESPNIVDWQKKKLKALIMYSFCSLCLVVSCIPIVSLGFG